MTTSRRSTTLRLRRVLPGWYQVVGWSASANIARNITVIREDGAPFWEVRDGRALVASTETKAQAESVALRIASELELAA